MNLIKDLVEPKAFIGLSLLFLDLQAIIIIDLLLSLRCLGLSEFVYSLHRFDIVDFQYSS